MIRVLHVIGSMGCGGAETMIMNLYRNMDRENIQFDFVVHTEKKCFFDDEIEKLGGKIYRTEKFNIRNYKSYKKWWKNFFAKHQEYKIVHGHINSSAAIYLSVAKKCGLKTIVHSHATKNTEKSLRNLAFKIMSYPIRYIADYFFACSQQAGEDRFGNNVTKSNSFKVLPNGIVVDNYTFNKNIRADIRKKYDVVESKYIIGHVGRFTYAKNHDFLIDILKNVVKQNENVELWLFGDGELKEKIYEKVVSLNLEKYVRFMGVKANINEFLQAIDCFVFPSLFEGLGIALIEAQAAGIPCVASTAIQEEADVGAKLLNTLPINEGAVMWADMVLKLNGYKRENTSEFVRESNYDIKNSANLLCRFYCEL